MMTFQRDRKAGYLLPSVSYMAMITLLGYMVVSDFIHSSTPSGIHRGLMVDDRVGMGIISYLARIPRWSSLSVMPEGHISPHLG